MHIQKPFHQPSEVGSRSHFRETPRDGDVIEELTFRHHLEDDALNHSPDLSKEVPLVGAAVHELPTVDDFEEVHEIGMPKSPHHFPFLANSVLPEIWPFVDFKCDFPAVRVASELDF